jgi:hypothetical protein
VLTPDALYVTDGWYGRIWQTASPTALPLNRSRPGLMRSGNTLTCTQGSWGNADRFAYVWQVNGTPQKDANPTLAIGKARTQRIVSCSVTAFNANGKTTVTSAQLRVRWTPARRRPYARSVSRSTALAAHRTSDQARCPVRFFAVEQLAHGTLPGRQSFTITGARYRFQCRVYFSLGLSVDRPGEPPGGGGGASFNPSQVPGVLAVSYMTPNACAHNYAVTFGLLRAGSDVVLARRGDRLTVLRHVAIPAVLDARGVLVFGVSADAPNEVIVKRPDGKRLLDQKLFQFPGRCTPD